jgi:CheY-like chemotaxis protein
MDCTTKILLVDDSKFLRLATERALARAGYQVSAANDGEHALEMARSERPDLILLDMLLPKMTGPDVLKALKADPATAGIAVWPSPRCRTRTQPACSMTGHSRFSIRRNSASIRAVKRFSWRCQKSS